MAKDFDYELFLKNLEDEELINENKIDKKTREAAIILDAIVLKNSAERFDLEDISMEHLDMIDDHLEQIIDYIEGEQSIEDVQNNIVFEINFKSNVDDIFKSLKSLRVPKQEDLF